MPIPVENISSALIDILKDRFTISDSIDEKGIFTDDPSKIKVFSFDYVDKIGKNRGTVVMSLLDDNESQNSLKIYFGQDLIDKTTNMMEEWTKFLGDMRKFAKIHLLGFDVRNINKSQITRRDIEHDLQLTKEDIEPMYESTFGPIDGTVKTSRQPLGSMHIIIKHTDRIDPEIKYGRSRKIQKIYLSNEKGEKFLLPFKSLLAARAMARHIEAGGTPYDTVGRNICALVEEMLSIGKFYRTHKNTQFSNTNATDALTASRERYFEIKKSLAKLTSKNGYTKNQPGLTGNVGEIEDDDDLFEDVFDGADFDEESQLALPYIMKAYRSRPSTPEESEFNKWVLTTKGQGKGDEILLDTEEDNG